MNFTLNKVIWDVNPFVIESPIKVAYYGLCWALGFLISLYFTKKLFKNEGTDEALLDKLFMYAFIGGIVGARLGHIFFYGPYWGDNGYFSNPINFLKVWEGGLASHGGAIVLVIAMFIYAYRVSKKHVLWGFDRLIIGATFTAAMIRIGNLMNHEIAGKITDSSLGFHFTKFTDPLTGLTDPEGVYRYPVQLFESFGYFLLFGILFFLYLKKGIGNILGLTFGIGLTGIFLTRMIVENFKIDQVASDADSALNYGQMLSIPFLFGGIAVLVWSIYNWKNGNKVTAEISKDSKELDS